MMAIKGTIMDKLTVYDMVRHKRDIDKHATLVRTHEHEQQMINRFRKTFQEDDYGLQDTE